MVEKLETKNGVKDFGSWIEGVAEQNKNMTGQRIIPSALKKSNNKNNVLVKKIGAKNVKIHLTDVGMDMDGANAFLQGCYIEVEDIKCKFSGEGGVQTEVFSYIVDDMFIPHVALQDGGIWEYLQRHLSQTRLEGLRLNNYGVVQQISERQKEALRIEELLRINLEGRHFNRGIQTLNEIMLLPIGETTIEKNTVPTYKTYIRSNGEFIERPRVVRIKGIDFTRMNTDNGYKSIVLRKALSDAVIGTAQHESCGYVGDVIQLADGRIEVVKDTEIESYMRQMSNRERVREKSQNEKGAR